MLLCAPGGAGGHHPRAYRGHTDPQQQGRSLRRWFGQETRPLARNQARKPGQERGQETGPRNRAKKRARNPAQGSRPGILPRGSQGRHRRCSRHPPPIRQDDLNTDLPITVLIPKGRRRVVDQLAILGRVGPQGLARGWHKMVNRIGAYGSAMPHNWSSASRSRSLPARERCDPRWRTHARVIHRAVCQLKRQQALFCQRPSGRDRGRREPV